ncbi:glycoside hydrolase family 3 N-terminal domain-containing protein [Scrofimicrobium canadense]|uniref:glycoside hydrolase family 3 N-terminal domain-containing protein n=1 Tax=Scrofimicrobium canadense TaxID=2652290 RepID=UPI00197D3041
MRIGGYSTKSVGSIQLPGTILKDGPAGFSATLTGGENGMAYPPAIVLASSWNSKLAHDFGTAIGEDSLQLGYAGWYAPSINIHRTPYSGRNFEYFSEDPILSGMMAAETVRGAQNKGVIVFVKHFAVNDQEVNRMGGAMMVDEQAIRELYLEPFELTVREGGARGMMASMNRLGPLWVGSNPGLMTEVLRNEWGFQGVVSTDQASFPVFGYQDLRQGLEAGTDLWLNTDAELWTIPEGEVDDSLLSNTKRAAHNVAYSVVNSNAMNGLEAGGKLVDVTPLWKIAANIATVVLGLGALLTMAFVTWRLVIQKRSRESVAIDATSK